MDTLKQKIDIMKQKKDLFIKFNFTGLELSECEKLCDDMECFMFILYKGEMVKRCKQCKKYDNVDTVNEYEETANILEYNPPTDPMLQYSDSYWYCNFCDEHNYFNNNYEVFRDYYDKRRIKYINFKQTDTIYIYNNYALEIENDDFTLNNEVGCKTPLDHIEIDEKLLSYFCIILSIDPNDEYDECYKYWMYEHKPEYDD